ncbi:hypothetical protein JCM6882_004314 [Rhodosporidiobolus microsporus]
MSSSAADLLAILRGTAPAPPAPPPPPQPQRTPSATSVYHTPLASSANSIVNVQPHNGQGGAGAGAGQGQQQQGKGNEGLEQLFRAFGQQHPSSGGGTPQQPSMPGALPQQPVLRKTSSSGADTASLLSLLRGGGGGGGGGSGSSNAQTSSAAIPSSEKTTPAAAAPTAPPPARAPPLPMSPQGGTAGELLASLMGGATSTTRSVPAPAAATNGAPPASSTGSPVSPTAAAVKEDEKEKTPQKPLGQPNFAFVSPFDVLDKLHAEDKAKASAPSSPSSSSVQKKPPLSSVPSHLLQPLRSPGSVGSTSSASASEAEDSPAVFASLPSIEQVAREIAPPPASSSPAPSSSTASSALPLPGLGSGSNGSTSTSTAASTFPTQFLAAQYLSSASPSASSPLRASFTPAPPSSTAPATRPSYAPSGLRLPRPPSTPHPQQAQPQTLRIDPSAPHLDSLAPHATASTPITLMESRGEYVGGGSGRAAARRAGTWERGIVYAMGAGGGKGKKDGKGVKGGKGKGGAKVRVIERESGARGVLKLAPPSSSSSADEKGKKEREGEDEIVDLRVAPAAKKDDDGSEREWRHVAVASREGRVVLWAVSERFGGEGEGGEGKEGEGEMKSTKILDLDFSAPSPTTTPAPTPTLVRFHPLYPSSPLLAIVFSEGAAVVLDVEKAAAKAMDGKTAWEVVGGAGERVEVGEGEGESILDLAFSPDGSALALITSLARYSVRSTASPSFSIFGGAIPLPPSAASGPAGTANGGGGSSSGSSSTVTPAPLAKSDAPATPPPQPCEVLFLSPTSTSSSSFAAAAATSPLVRSSASPSPPPAALAVSFTRGTEVVVFPLSAASPLPAGAVTSLSFPPPPPSLLSAEEAEKTHYAHLAFHPPTHSLVVSSTLRGSLWAFRLAFPPSHPIFSSTGELGDADFLTTVANADRMAGELPRAVRVEHVLETPVGSGAVVSFMLSPSSPSSSPSSSDSAQPAALDAKAPRPQAAMAAGKTPFDVLVTHAKGIDLVQVVAERPREYGVGTAAGRGEGRGEVRIEVREETVRREETSEKLPMAAFAFGNANPFGAAAGGMNGHGGLHPRDREHEHDSDLLEHEHDSDADDFERAMAAGRRMSLEGSIYVSSEVEVCVEEPEHWEKEIEFTAGEMNGAPHPHPEDREESVDEPAMGDLGAAGLPLTPNVEVAPPPANAASSSSPSRVGSNLSPSLAAVAALPPRSPKRAAGANSGGNGGGGANTPQQEAEVIRELRRIEQGFRGEIGKVVRGELEKHVHHLEEDRLHALESTTAREETLLKLALQAVKKDTTKLVENAVREQVQRYVGPVVKEAVRGEVGRGVEGAVRQVLPAELDKQLSRPDIAFPLSASIATTIAPPLERSLTHALMSAVVPSLERQLASAVDGLVTSIRQEMLDVRKEIVQEQSGAVAVLEDEVGALKSEVAGLRVQMEQLLDAFAASRIQPPVGSPRMGQLPQQQQQQQRRPAPAPAAPQLATGPNALPTAPYHHGIPASLSSASLASVAGASVGGGGSAAYPLPPIPRTHTPPERYEELFTETMQPQHEPEFTALVHLINSSPAGRIDAVFPPVSVGGGAPRISMAVVLSLAFRLSQVLASRDGRMDDEGRRMLAWLRRAVTACDGKQPPEFHDMIPRILSQVLEHLITRGRRLAMVGDTAGVNEIRLIEQYARARLSLFQQGGGEGVEGFRR